MPSDGFVFGVLLTGTALLLGALKLSPSPRLGADRRALRNAFLAYE